MGINAWVYKLFAPHSKSNQFNSKALKIKKFQRSKMPGKVDIFGKAICLVAILNLIGLAAAVEVRNSIFNSNWQFPNLIKCTLFYSQLV